MSGSADILSASRVFLSRTRLLPTAMETAFFVPTMTTSPKPLSSGTPTAGSLCAEVSYSSARS